MKKKVLLGIALIMGILVNVSAADPQTYAARLGYKFQNNWIFSQKSGDYTLLGTAGTVRGMAVKNGEMLFCSRNSGNQILVVDSVNGSIERTVTLASNVFTYLGRNKANTADSTWTVALPNNDIQVDDAGNVLVCNLANAKGEHFQIWKIDMATGDGTLVLDYVTPSSAVFRYDYFGISGSVTSNAVILSAQNSSWNVVKWEISGGSLVSATPTTITVDHATDGRTLKTATSLGGSPRVYPYPDYFYVDGNPYNTPRLNYSGYEIDGFWNNTRNGLVDSTTVTGSKITMDGGQNGIKEFQVGSDYFMVMASSNPAATVPSTFRIYKFADASKSYATMDCMWTFPAQGMGSTGCSYRSSIPAVEVSGNKAYIYVYVGENGYAKYTMVKDFSTGINTSKSNIGIRLNNGKICLSEQVRSAEVFSAGGQRMASVRNVSEIAAPTQKGIYLVSVVDANDVKKVEKIIVQ